MATPSMHRSFDASLTRFDPSNYSFSSTETATSSGSSHKENKPASISQLADTPTIGHTEETVLKNLTTSDLYKSWASTYDTDGNVLQAVDDLQMQNRLGELIADADQRRRESGSDNRPMRILDLGCGTGRNIMKVLDYVHGKNWDGSAVEIEGWDASEAMLEQARNKCKARTAGGRVQPGLKLVELDEIPSANVGQFDVIISTLVLEHVPIKTYWTAVASLMKSGAVGRMSNMHPDMSAYSVAGYKDADGNRLVGRSFLHTVQETADGARAAGLVISDVREVAVTTDMLEKGEVDAERGRKWEGRKIWYGMCFWKPL